MANCIHCKTKFKQKYITYRFCESTDECKEAGLNYKIQKAIEQGRKNLEKSKKEKFKVMKENVKTLSEYEQEAKKSFQHFIRLRDKNKPCISCGNKNPSDWCGSHYFPAGIYSGLIFDERNCHGACNTYCNKYLSGNLINYRKGLIERYGVEFVENLEADADIKRNYKWTKEQLIAKKLQYDLKIKELK